MLSFEIYLTRYGEIGVQAIIERLERYEGTCGKSGHSLEERWKALMLDNPARRANAA